MMFIRIASLLLCLLAARPALAGVYYSGDRQHPPPAAWRGYLPDLRLLRLCGLATDTGRNPLRDRYADDALALEAAAKTKPLTADRATDLAALYIRLGTPQKAIALLRLVLRDHPDHFRAAANLGTAWQEAGDLEQASAALEEAVRLAPAEHREAERLHLRLVKLRLKEGKPADAPDDLFGVRYVGESGKPEAGTIAPAARKKLPDNAVALVQQLAVWLPSDARLLWQLSELANAHGDVRTAANILDGCVVELGMKSESARARRQLYRSAADELAKSDKHDTHLGTLVLKSPRLFIRILDEAKLPKVDPKGVNSLPWTALAETTVGKKFDVTVLKYVEQLEGKVVTISGFMVPANGSDAVSEFLFVEFAVGCWFCETPGPTQLLAVQLANGQAASFVRGQQTVTGTLKVNHSDPEGYLFTLTKATIKPVE